MYRPSLALVIVLGCTFLCCNQKHDEPQTVVRDTVASKPTTKAVRKDSAKNAFAASSVVPKFQGRCINLSICGIDARLNEGIHHADANHVIRFWLDSGAVEIVDIPRDTPMDAGLDSNLNILTNLRAHKGRKAYLDSVAKIIGAKKIDYYCELGFSQAMGMLELLGHKDDAAQTLRVLRSRQGFDAGDFQRCYNQGTFMSQVLTRHFGKATGWFRDPMLRAGLLLVDTDMPLDTIKKIIDVLESNGFPGNKKCYVHVMPNFYYHLPRYDFMDSDSVKALNGKIDERLQRVGIALGVPSQLDYIQRLDTLITKAASDTTKRPRNTIALLNRPFQQRSWMQISDKTKRAEVVQRICTLMTVAYLKSGKKADAEKMKKFYEQHKELLEQ